MSKLSILKDVNGYYTFPSRARFVIRKYGSGIDWKDYDRVQLFFDAKTEARLNSMTVTGPDSSVSVEGGRFEPDGTTLNYYPERVSFLVLGAEGHPHICVSDLKEHYEMLLDWLKNKTLDFEYSEIQFNGLTNGWNAQSMYTSHDSEVFNKLYTFQKRYAYGCVYYEMYKKFMEKMKEIHPGEKLRLHIVSIGCGNKTDAIGLQYAIEDNQDVIVKTRYIGIDPVNWNDYDTFAWLNDTDEFIKLDDLPAGYTGDPSRFFVDKEIDKLSELSADFATFEEGDGHPVYLVVFPNSISEIRPAVLVSDLMDGIRTAYSGKETYILLSKNPSTIDDFQIGEIEKHSGTPIIDETNTHTNWYIWNNNPRLGRSEWNKKAGWFGSTTSGPGIFERFDSLILFDQAGNNKDAFIHRYEEWFKKEWDRVNGPGYEDEMYDLLSEKVLAMKLGGETLPPPIDENGDVVRDEKGNVVEIEIPDVKYYSLAKRCITSQKYIRYKVFRL